MDNLVITHATSEQISRLFLHNHNPQLDVTVRPNQLSTTFTVTITGHWSTIQQLLNKANGPQ